MANLRVHKEQFVPSGLGKQLITIRSVRSVADLAGFRDLCLEYAATLEYTGECRALESQCFDAEMAALQAGHAGAYARPGGEILLAFDGAVAVGCIALRPLTGEEAQQPGCGGKRSCICAGGEAGPTQYCEMKRMYVRPTHRSHGVGRQLAEAIVAAARERGYRAMRLDTGATMLHAAALYEKLGFRDIPAYNRDPVPGTRWMELAL